MVKRVEQGQQPSSWPADLQAYYKWATDDGRIVLQSNDLLGLDMPPNSPLYRKTFGNIMDTFPEMAQIGAMPALVVRTEGLSLVGTLASDTLGHLGEGITIIVRTENRELY